MKIQPDPNLPIVPPTESAYIKSLSFRLNLVFKLIASQVNGISEGRQANHYNSLTSVPTAGTWATGDFVRNSTPSELGAVSSKYIIDGWRCVSGGTPGTWVQCRYLTGN